ncbi:MAG: DUF559 domain-containing protein [Micropruina sp.]
MKLISELLEAEGGILARRSHRSIQHHLDYQTRRGRLQALLPGVYAPVDPSWEARILAAVEFRPDCVLTGAAAARLLWWPECPITAVTAAVRAKVKATTPGYRWEQRTIPDDLVVDRGTLRVAAPAVSVLDLIPVLGGQVIDEGLRRRAVDLSGLQQALALMPRRPQNRMRRDLIEDSRDEPWSEAERRTHRLLRSAGLTGWRTNHTVGVGPFSYTVDVVFLTERVVIEIDGWEFHHGRAAFTSDRWRYARLAAAGWRVLPFAATAVEDEPEAFIGLVIEALAERR